MYNEYNVVLKSFLTFAKKNLRNILQPVIYVNAFQGICSDIQNNFKFCKQHSLSLSLNSYTIFHPNGPNFFRS